jgi:hypothetical protein
MKCGHFYFNPVSRRGATSRNAVIRRQAELLHRRPKAVNLVAAPPLAFREVLPGDHLRELATRLLDTYELRSADSVQLAAALTWCQQRPARRDFLCGDERLGRAALAAGFSVLDIY